MVTIHRGKQKIKLKIMPIDKLLNPTIQLTEPFQTDPNVRAKEFPVKTLHTGVNKLAFK